MCGGVGMDSVCVGEWGWTVCEGWGWTVCVCVRGGGGQCVCV